MMPVRLNARNWPSFASVIQVAPPTPAPASEEHAQVQPAVPKRRRRRECVVRPPPRRIDPMMQTVDYRRVADTCALRADMKRAGQPEAIALLAPKPSAHALAIAHADSVSHAHSGRKKSGADAVSSLLVVCMDGLGLRLKRKKL